MEDPLKTGFYLIESKDSEKRIFLNNYPKKEIFSALRKNNLPVPLCAIFNVNSGSSICVCICQENSFFNLEKNSAGLYSFQPKRENEIFDIKIQVVKFEGIFSLNPSSKLKIKDPTSGKFVSEIKVNLKLAGGPTSFHYSIISEDGFEIYINALLFCS